MVFAPVAPSPVWPEPWVRRGAAGFNTGLDGYRLYLNLSRQYLDQLSSEIRQAVFGNAGTMIAFRIGHTNA